MKTRKKLTDTFCTVLLKNFSAYCEQQQQQQQLTELITYLLDQELIDTSKVRKYTVLEAFTEIEKGAALKKTEAVRYIAQRFNISIRTVWSILRKTPKNEKMEQ